VVYSLFRHAGLISAKKARTRLKNGALVVDVRTVGEFVSGHLPIAVNLPVNEFETSMTSYVKDKKQVILVHCQSGIRSSIAKKKLKAMLTTGKFNLDPVITHRLKLSEFPLVMQLLQSGEAIKVVMRPD
jgi:phage shock protein E